MRTTMMRTTTKSFSGIALTLALLAANVAPADAGTTPGSGDDLGTAVFVMNNHLVTVRVFAEDAGGKLHNLGRVARGRLGTFAVPAEVAASEFRIKVFPESPDSFSGNDGFGVKTNPLSVERDRQVTMWLEADLAQSIVEISRD